MVLSIPTLLITTSPTPCQQVFCAQGTNLCYNLPVLRPSPKRNKAWGKFVRARRLARSESQEAFGAHFGIGGAYISGWEVHGKVPAREVVIRGVKVLGEDEQEWLQIAGYEPATLDQIGLTVSEPIGERSGAVETPAVIGDVGVSGTVTWRTGSFHEEGTPMPNRFCLMVDSRAVGEFRYGTTMLIECDRVPTPGCYVVVKDANDAFRLVRFRSRRGPQLEVESVGPFNPGQAVTCEAAIVGVVSRLLDVPMLPE